MTFKPHITLACVVQAEGKFLMVEELVDGKMTLNQPAGHLEAHETLLAGAQRELWEETNISVPLQSLIKVFQWIAADNIPFIRFTFSLDLPAIIKCQPNDQDIIRCRWLSHQEILAATNLRSPLVRESILCYNQPNRYPLSLIEYFDFSG